MHVRCTFDDDLLVYRGTSITYVVTYIFFNVNLLLLWYIQFNQLIVFPCSMHTIYYNESNSAAFHCIPYLNAVFFDCFSFALL